MYRASLSIHSTIKRTIFQSEKHTLMLSYSRNEWERNLKLTRCLSYTQPVFGQFRAYIF